MFNKIYSFEGVHANKVNDLTRDFDGNGNRMFQRNLDIYILAPLVGFLYQAKADVDKDTSIKPTKIFVEQLLSAQDELEFNYKLIMLLDKKSEPDAEKRIDRAFRGDNLPEYEELYEQYVRGGVDILYTKLMDGVNNPNEYVVRLFDFLEEFDERYNQTIDIDRVLELCRKAKS